MTIPTPTSLVFTVKRSEPELVAPAKPTPKELKLLSDIDDQEGLRFQIPVIQFYKYEPSMRGKDPVRVIRDALAKTLVFYYPFAGRLRELAGRKLAVDCTGEGVMFVGAEADVRLEDFGAALHPPFPCVQELLFDVPGSAGVIGVPLLHFQVTRLKCGGFIMALRLNHTMSDAAGIVQFLTAFGEIARGADTPSVPPVWGREVLNARDPPRVTCIHRQYKHIENNMGTIFPVDDMSHRSFFFGRAEVAAIRLCLPSHLRQSSTFELLTACLWRCRTLALKPNPEEEVRMVFTGNARPKFNPPLPRGFYGNAFAFLVAAALAGELCSKPLAYAVELVKRAKEELTEEYMRSLADLMVLKGRPNVTIVRSYFVSDLQRAGFEDVDFGWGKVIYGGTAIGGSVAIPSLGSFYLPVKNGEGEQGIVLPVCLPAPAMDIFIKELDGILKRSISSL